MPYSIGLKIRVFLNREILIDFFRDDTKEGQIYLHAGRKYALRMEGVDEGDYAKTQLFWQGENFYKELIPSEMLWHYDTECECPLNSENNQQCGSRTQVSDRLN